jgi:flagellar hook-length control protein FliK
MLTTAVFSPAADSLTTNGAKASGRRGMRNDDGPEGPMAGERFGDALRQASQRPGEAKPTEKPAIAHGPGREKPALGAAPASARHAKSKQLADGANPADASPGGLQDAPGRATRGAPLRRGPADEPAADATATATATATDPAFSQGAGQSLALSASGGLDQADAPSSTEDAIDPTAAAGAGAAAVGRPSADPAAHSANALGTAPLATATATATGTADAPAQAVSGHDARTPGARTSNARNSPASPTGIEPREAQAEETARAADTGLQANLAAATQARPAWQAAMSQAMRERAGARVQDQSTDSGEAGPRAIEAAGNAPARASVTEGPGLLPGIGSALGASATSTPAWAATADSLSGTNGATPAGDSQPATGLLAGTADGLDPPVGSPGFAPALGARISILARDGIEHAQLRLNPAELGPVAVQLALDGTNVRVDLAADHWATRQALEQALPSLAASLRDAGFTLSGGGVSQQGAQGQGAGQGAGQTPGDGAGRRTETPGAAGADQGPTLPRPTAWARSQDGLVDLFA